MSALEKMSKYIEQHEESLHSISQKKLHESAFRKTSDAGQTWHRQPEAISMVMSSTSSIDNMSGADITIATNHGLDYFTLQLQQMQQYRHSQLQQVMQLIEHECQVAEQLDRSILTQEERDRICSEKEFEAFLLGKDEMMIDGKNEQKDEPEKEPTLFTRSNLQHIGLDGSPIRPVVINELEVLPQRLQIHNKSVDDEPNFDSNSTKIGSSSSQQRAVQNKWNKKISGCNLDTGTDSRIRLNHDGDSNGLARKSNLHQNTRSRSPPLTAAAADAHPQEEEQEVEREVDLVSELSFHGVDNQESAFPRSTSQVANNEAQPEPPLTNHNENDQQEQEVPGVPAATVLPATAIGTEVAASTNVGKYTGAGTGTGSGSNRSSSRSTWSASAIGNTTPERLDPRSRIETEFVVAERILQQLGNARRNRHQKLKSLAKSWEEHISSPLNLSPTLERKTAFPGTRIDYTTSRNATTTNNNDENNSSSNNNNGHNGILSSSCSGGIRSGGGPTADNDNPKHTTATSRELFRESADLNTSIRSTNNDIDNNNVSNSSNSNSSNSKIRDSNFNPNTNSTQPRKHVSDTPEPDHSPSVPCRNGSPSTDFVCDTDPDASRADGVDGVDVPTTMVTATATATATAAMTTTISGDKMPILDFEIQNVGSSNSSPGEIDGTAAITLLSLAEQSLDINNFGVGLFVDSPISHVGEIDHSMTGMNDIDQQELGIAYPARNQHQQQQQQNRRRPRQNVVILSTAVGDDYYTMRGGADDVDGVEGLDRFTTSSIASSSMVDEIVMDDGLQLTAMATRSTTSTSTTKAQDITTRISEYYQKRLNARNASHVTAASGVQQEDSSPPPAPPAGNRYHCDDVDSSLYRSPTPKTPTHTPIFS